MTALFPSTPPSRPPAASRIKPSALRSIARSVRDGSRQTFQRLRLNQGLATLERTLRIGATPGPRLLNQLVRGWGNEAWSAGTPLLQAILDWLPRTKGAIAECGSGLSTLVLATGASQSGRHVYTFEHDADWAGRVESRMPSRLRKSVKLLVTPIRSYGAFDWYSLEGVAAPASIGFVVCDGPPGATRGGRYGLGPVLRSQLAPGCIVLLDDTQRPSESEVVSRWCSEMGASVVHKGETYNILSLGTA
ncbi:MAG: class I SAM-dependent methyltransferase [Gammaproteobacteria bacterium]